MLTVLVLGCGSNPKLTQSEAEEMAGVFCLPTYLPDDVNPTPFFYAVGEPEIPDATAWYQNMETSEYVFFIRMMNVTHTSGDRQFYNPAQYCQKTFTLSSNNFTICDDSTRPYQLDYYEKRVLTEEEPFVTHFRWLAQREANWTVYHIHSTLSLEATKKIVASMCLPQ